MKKIFLGKLKPEYPMDPPTLGHIFTSLGDVVKDAAEQKDSDLTLSPDLVTREVNIQSSDSFDLDKYQGAIDEVKGDWFI